ncbi:hypothetical protein GOBAR_AA31052 [Gossypium barbadense]|uniref:Uncharacterized protein n=1 Tax=Gossypium barbadense TaxID=3634 RepID=A0A2P5WEY0_GOSBA|nr:hypothetical protein GOBAR_AA31052 [Gossypium barbadense]
MSVGPEKYTKIRHIVRLRQMLQRWRNKARMSARRIPSDVLVGHVAIYVWTSYRRFVVRVFRKLLIQAKEEYGFSNQGLLAILCDE